MPVSSGRVVVAALAAAFAFAPAESLRAQVQLPSAVTTAFMPPAWLRAYEVHAGTVQSLHVPASPTSWVGVEVGLGGLPCTLELAPYDVRGPFFQLWERTATGLVQAPPCAVHTWRGAIAGDAGSAVAATLDAGKLTAYVRTGSGDLWIVQPLLDAIPGAPASSHVVFRGADSAPANGHCGVVAPSLPMPRLGGGLDVQYECDLALEADFPLYQANGSSLAATQNDVLGIVNAVDLIFRTDVQIHFQVTQLIVDTAADPYSSSNASTLLSQFQNYWNANYGAITRDVAHLFTGRSVGAASSGTIGLAYVGATCYLANGYGLSETHWSLNYAYRVGVTAHELGHNFNASHCDGQPTCNVMCSVIGGCSGSVSSFSAGEQQQIVSYRQSVGCLAQQATMPAITSATPGQLPTVNPTLVTLQGAGFVGTTAVTVGSQQVTTGIQVVSDTTLRFTPPYGQPLGAQPVSVTNPAGTSNSTLLNYTSSDPCVVVVPAATYSGQLMYWRMGGLPNDAAILGISFASTTSPFLGFQLLDYLLVLWTGVLDARGMAMLSVTVPPGLLTGVTLRSQLLDIDAVAGTLHSISTPLPTWIVF